MKNWTKNNLHEFDIEASNMGNNQQELADWVESYIFKNARVDTIQSMLDNADSYLSNACEALGWVNVPQTGGFEVNIW